MNHPSENFTRDARRPRSLRSYQLAVISEAVLDIPPRIRFLLIIVGVIGIVLIIMESLVGRQEYTIEIDTMLHFSGYLVLALVFVLALRPVLFIPGLIGLVGMGIAIEYLQAFTARSPQWDDVYTNTLGVAIGGLLGLIIRGGYAYLRKELAVQNVKRNLIRFMPNDIILREGDPIEDFFIIKTGNVQVIREVKGKPVKLAVLSVGDIIGALGVILGEPQYGTVIALERVTLYRLNLEQLMEVAGGQDLPVSLVLTALTKKLKDAADELAKFQISIPDER